MQVPAEEVPLCKKPVPQCKPKELPQLDDRPGPRKPRPHCCRRALKARQVPRGRFYPPPGKLPSIREDTTEFWVERCEYDSDDGDYDRDGGDYDSDDGDYDSDDYGDYDSDDGDYDDYGDYDDFGDYDGDDSDDEDDDETKVTLLKGMECSIIYTRILKDTGKNA